MPPAQPYSSTLHIPGRMARAVTVCQVGRIAPRPRRFPGRAGDSHMPTFRGVVASAQSWHFRGEACPQ